MSFWYILFEYVLIKDTKIMIEKKKERETKSPLKPLKNSHHPNIVTCAIFMQMVALNLEFLEECLLF